MADSRPVTAETANALVTEAFLSTDELTMLREHYSALCMSLACSGPRFSSARRDAADMHNRAVRRLRGIRDEARRRATMEQEDDLLEIR